MSGHANVVYLIQAVHMPTKILVCMVFYGLTLEEPPIEYYGVIFTYTGIFKTSIILSFGKWWRQFL